MNRSRMNVVSNATSASVVSTPSIMANANTTPASGTPRDNAKQHGEERQRAWDQPGDEADEQAFAVRMVATAPCAQQQPQADRDQHSPAHRFEVGARPTPPSVRVISGAASRASSTADPTWVSASTAATANARKAASRDPAR